MKRYDPDTHLFSEVCKSLVGAKIRLSYTIELLNGDRLANTLSNCNVVGDCLENVLFPFLKEKISTIEEGPKQASPDFWNRDREFEWELKVFNCNPNFDINNFTSYINQLGDNLEKKMYKTKYMIFKYDIYDSQVVIKDYRVCNVWDLVSYDKKHPISIQMKKGVWYNIRPCGFKDIGKNKTDKMFVEHICKAITECPNNLVDREDLIHRINQQFLEVDLSDLAI